MRSLILDAPAIELLSGDFYLETIPFALRASDLFLIAGLSILLSTAAAWFQRPKLSFRKTMYCAIDCTFVGPAVT